jgi:hypothetical protein
VVQVAVVVTVQMVVKKINQQTVVIQQDKVTEITVEIQEVLLTLRHIQVQAAVVQVLLELVETVVLLVPVVQEEVTQLAMVQHQSHMPAAAVAAAEVQVQTQEHPADPVAEVQELQQADIQIMV